MKLANPQYLRAKSLSKSDKKRAAKLCLRRMEMLALEEGLVITSTCLEQLINDSETNRLSAVSTYGWTLLERIKGISDGPAVLALWMQIAWSPHGSPIKNFELTTQDIINAENFLVSRMIEFSS
jgi:hypothetical protein